MDRKLKVAAFCSLTLLIAACGRPPASFDAKNIFGDDDREELSVDSSPGKAVGRMDLGCSGAMVGRVLVLTAAHCVYDPSTDQLKTTVKEFKVGYKNGEFLQKSWINAVWIGTKQPVEDRRNDWAILQLSDPIGDEAGWFGIKAVDFAETLPLTVNVAGYASDKNGGEIAQVARGCYVHKVDENGRLLHDCDAATGTSGGPMYVTERGEPYIVGITAAEFRSGNRSMNRDSYTHQYANIGVSGAGFVNAVSKLRGSVDIGIAAPAIAEAHYVVNLNANSGGSDDNVTRPTEPGTDRGAQRAALEQYLVDNGSYIAADAQALSMNAAAIRDYANSWGFFDLATAAERVSSYAGYADLYATRLAQQSGLRSQGTDDLLRTLAEVNTFIERLNYEFYGRFAVGTRVRIELDALMTSVQRSKERLSAYVRVSGN